MFAGEIFTVGNPIFYEWNFSSSFFFGLNVVLTTRNNNLLFYNSMFHSKK